MNGLAWTGVILLCTVTLAALVQNGVLMIRVSELEAVLWPLAEMHRSQLARRQSNRVHLDFARARGGDVDTEDDR